MPSTLQGQSALLTPPIAMPIVSRNTLTDTPRGMFNPVRLTLTINHRRYSNKNTTNVQICSHYKTALMKVEFGHAVPGMYDFWDRANGKI